MITVSEQQDSGYVVNKCIADFHRLLQSILPVRPTEFPPDPMVRVQMSICLSLIFFFVCLIVVVDG